MIAGLENTFVFIDDLVVREATIEEHDHNLHELFKDAFNAFKIMDSIFVWINVNFSTKINYLGYVIDGQ